MRTTRGTTRTGAGAGWSTMTGQEKGLFRGVF
jgi:hypothetical protein